MVEDNEDNGDLLQKVPCTHCCTQCSQTCSQPPPTHASAGDSWTLTGMSGSVSFGVTAPFYWVLMYTRFCSCPPRVCFPSPVQVVVALHTEHTQKSLTHVRLFATPWIIAYQAPRYMGFSRHEYWSGLPFPYGGVNGNLRQEGLCHTQVYCTQSPCPCSSPLLTHTSSGDTQTQLQLSLCGVSGSWCTQGLFEPSECLWWVWGLILNAILLLLPSCWGFSFALGGELYFFGGIQHSPVDVCSAVSCNFGVLTGEDECTSSCFTIFYSRRTNDVKMHKPAQGQVPEGLESSLQMVTAAKKKKKKKLKDTLFLGASKSLQMVTVAMKLKFPYRCPSLP